MAAEAAEQRHRLSLLHSQVAAASAAAAAEASKLSDQRALVAVALEHKEALAEQLRALGRHTDEERRRALSELGALGAASQSLSLAALSGPVPSLPAAAAAAVASSAVPVPGPGTGPGLGPSLQEQLERLRAQSSSVLSQHSSSSFSSFSS